VEPAHLDDRICNIGFIRVADLKPVLDALDNDAAELGCSGVRVADLKPVLDALDNDAAELGCSGVRVADLKPVLDALMQRSSAAVAVSIRCFWS
jgi:hypothetical protein